MAALDYEDVTCQLPWTVPELQQEAGIKEKLLKYNQVTSDYTKKYAHSKRTLREEVYRTPINMAFLLRNTISDNKEHLKQAIIPDTMTRLNGLVDMFMEGYLNQIRVVAFPLPFQLLQMARTLLFVW